MLKRDEGRHQVGHEENAATGVPGETREIRIVSEVSVRFNSSLSLCGHRSYLIIKPSYFSFCLLMRREKETRERVYALYLTSKGSPANNELYFFPVVKKKKLFISGGGEEEK